ncbi:MAG: hypothetical protein A3D10_07620 [Omnitrophica WOR_2 bacterium RIFCSPHIGHO2_02_FULL_48_11]|nr:MAG: hypothetical protein A3D10_07620 [Omnitrophica WOR_2 bacterium RIFCSPHIGHO2_02_FULL_48_11]
MFLSVLSTTANAATFKLDSIYTTVSFRVKHLMGYAVGSFTKFDGAIQLNDGNDAVTAVNGTVDMTTIDTRHKDRDNDLRSARFFDVEKFPTMTFKSTKIEKNKITGDLTLHGVTKKVTLDYAFWGLAKDQRGKTKTAVSISGVVNRKDFGIVYNIKTDDGTWLLGDEVELRIELHGILK